MSDNVLVDEELLTSGPRAGGRRRMVLGVAVLLLIAGVVIGVLVSSHSDHRSSKAPAPTGASTTSSPVAAGGPGPAPAVLLNGFVYIIDEGMLYMRGTSRFEIHQTVVGPFREPNAAYVLVADEAHRRIWVVQSVGSIWGAYEYDSATLEQISAQKVGGRVNGAAVLAGDLYVDTNYGVFRIVRPDTGPRDATPLPGGRAIAADPSRGRLLVLALDGGRTQVRAERPSAQRPDVVAHSPVFGRGSLAVVDGHIWAGGEGSRGAVLVQLDPRTLAPVGHSRLEAEVGSGAVIVAVGRQDLLVRSEAGGDELWCVDGGSGAVRQKWAHAPGPAVLDGADLGSHVFTVAADFTPRPLNGTNCRG